MPQTKTTKKKATGKTSSVKVGGGGVGTRVSKLNLKIVIPIVVLVAALGGFYIFRKSGASGNYTFVRNAGQMWGGQYVKKQNGSSYVALSNKSGSNYANVSINSSESVKSGEFCSHFLGGDGTLKMVVYLEDGSARSGNSYKLSGSSGNLCTTNSWDSKVRQIEVSATNTNTSIQVDTIYGKLYPISL